MYRIVSLSVLLTLIVVLGITFFRVIAPFLLPLFLAGVVVILAQPLFRYIVTRTGGHVRVAAGITTATVVAAILVPIIVGTVLGSMQLRVLARDVSISKQWDDLFGVGERQAEPVVEWVTSVVNNFRDEPLTPRELRNYTQNRIRSELIALGNRSLGMVAGVFLSLVSAILGLLIFTVALYYFLADGPAILEATEQMIPVYVNYQRELVDEFCRVVRSVVSATFLASLAQALATTIALWLAGFDHLLTLFLLALLSSLIPMLGTWLVWAPCAISLWWSGSHVAAILLAVYGMAFVGILDNIVRTYVLNSDTKLHPLLALISVLGGLQVLGLWGVFIGPIVASCLHALVKIFNHELAILSQQKFGTADEVTPDRAAPAASPTKSVPIAQTDDLLTPSDTTEAEQTDGPPTPQPVSTDTSDVPAAAPPSPATSGKSAKNGRGRSDRRRKRR